MNVGHELLDVPLPDMVTKLALGIAAAQQALDQNSVETAKALSETEVDLQLAITQVIDENGDVQYHTHDPVAVSLLQIGLMPTFYQFAEATIEVSMDISTTTSRETDVRVKSEFEVGFSVFSKSINVDVSHNRKFGKEVQGTSRLITRLVPVPPPERITPELRIVDNRPSDEDE